ncbi:YopX family protein [Enterococcus faecalis]
MIPKFRAWDKRSKEMWKVSTLHIEDEYVDLFKKNIYENPLNDPSAKFRDVILMQSTGLKDKNGVEIFEGDLVYYIPFESHINNSIIVFEKGSFCKKMLRNGKLTSVKFIDSEEYEVIGNIHENPELLEVAE